MHKVKGVVVRAKNEPATVETILVPDPGPEWSTVVGALWSAWSDQGPLQVGDLVEVAGIENLRLYVRRIVPEQSSGSKVGNEHG